MIDKNDPRKNDPRLTAFVLGELDPSELRELTEAIAASDELKTEVEQLRETIRMLGSAYDSESNVHLAEEQRTILDQACENVRAVESEQETTLRRTGGPETGRRFYRERLFYLTLAVAAAILLMLVPLGAFQGSWFGNSSVALKSRPEFTGEAAGETIEAEFEESQDNDKIAAMENGKSSRGRSFGEKSLGKSRPSSGRPSSPSVNIGGVPLSRPDRSGTADDQEEESKMERGMASRIPEDLESNKQADFDDLADHPLPAMLGKSLPESMADPGSNEPDWSYSGDATRESKGARLEMNEFFETDSLGSSQSAQSRPAPTAQPGLAGSLDSAIESFGKSSLADQGGFKAEGVLEIEGDRELPEVEAVVGELLKRVAPSGTAEIPIKLAPTAGNKLAEAELFDLSRAAGRPAEFRKEKDGRAGELEGQLDRDGKRALSKSVAGAGRVAARKRGVRLQDKTWKRVKAIPNTTRLMVGDKDDLELNGMQVNVQVDGFRARVLIDCFYYNHYSRQLEGTFKLRLPDDASLYYFAFGQSAYEFQPGGSLAAEEFLSAGRQFISLRPADISRVRQRDWQNVKEARLVPREKAAHAYRQTVRRRVDPALVEWSGAGVFNARIFPLLPKRLHRVVIGYDVNLTRSGDDLVYELALPESTGECKVNVNVLEVEGVEYAISPPVKPDQHIARVDRLNQLQVDKIRILSQQRQQLSARLGKSHPQVLEIDQQIDAISDLRNQVLEAAVNNKLLESRYHFDNPEAGTIRLTVANASSLLLRSVDDAEGSFWATRIAPDLPRVAVRGNDRAIFLVDTSLSSQPDKFNVWLQLLQATLTNNRDTLKEFSVLFFNIENHFWRDQYVDNTEANVSDLMEFCQNLALEGATDLYGAIDKIATTDWVAAKGQAPDLFLLTDGAANWGETNLRLLNRRVTENELGSLFAYQTGMSGTAISNLRFITGNSGGAVFSVTGEDQIQSASTAHRQRPWRIESINVEGATDVMTAGRVQWIYPGQSLTVVGRVMKRDGQDATLGKIVLNVSQSGSHKKIEFGPHRTVTTDLASRVYGQVAVGQLESLDDAVIDVATAYARHFRITGRTCSLLMLESEAEYQRYNIKPEEDLFVIKTRDAGDIVAATLLRRASELADPKQQLLASLARLESMPGMEFKLPTALKLAFEDMEIVAISSSPDSFPITKTKLPDEYLKMLTREDLDYELIKQEADRRLKNIDDRLEAPNDEALKVMSSLVERNPGDLVMARDVAFSAMELERPAAAYHLLRRVASARPNESSVYLALGQCLSQLGKADMAIVFYEVAVNSSFPDRADDYKKIVATEYSVLLRDIVAGRLNSNVLDFANARLASLTASPEKLGIGPRDLVITMMWNTDQTDIDLHVVEPSGEECNYQHRETKSGGQLTRDITDGFGPEMYSLAKADPGEYRVLVKYFAGNLNRTDLRSKVYLTIHRNFGRHDATVTRKSIELSEVGGKELVDVLSVK